MIRNPNWELLTIIWVNKILKVICNMSIIYLNINFKNKGIFKFCMESRYKFESLRRIINNSIASILIINSTDELD